MGALKEDLTTRTEELRETHISWVFLTDDHAYKVKKPVSLGFLDFSSIDQRKQACEAEVELNRRLSPDVYVGVVPVTRDEIGVHRFGGRGEPVDWAVQMKRLPDENRLDVRLAAKDLSGDQLAAVASKIAAFHATARCDEHTGSFGEPEAISVNVTENFDQTRNSIEDHLSADEAREIEQWQSSFLREHGDVLRARVASGRVRDGHGDLRLEQMYVDERSTVRVLDCIEFNERFRYADVCADVAFLSMDLAWHGRVDLAERFLALYAMESNDYDLYPLVDFYESYRAYVRGKVASILASDMGAPIDVRARAREEARRYYLLALAAERRPLIPPIVVAVGGPIASGKSTIADRLGAAMGAPVLNSDRTRKHLLGAKPTEKVHDGSWSGAYDPAFTEEVYDEVYRRADAVLRSGRPVILDASFRSVAMRARARKLAEDHGVPFRFVECLATPMLCKLRLEERQQHQSVSDGRIEIFDDFMKKWEDVVELPRDVHLQVETARPGDENVLVLKSRLPTWPKGLNA